MNFFQKTVSKILGHHPIMEEAPSLRAFSLPSEALGRSVFCEAYLPAGYEAQSGRAYSLVLFNDGQDLPRMDFAGILKNAHPAQRFPPFVAIGIHCSERRIREYGTAQRADYKGRGDLAPQYTRFVLEELMPYLHQHFRVTREPKHTAFAGFSLGGLSALDIAWAHPEVFGVAGVFSGSLWWRSEAATPEAPDAHRIMHELVEKSAKTDPSQRFWFQCGTLDETDDRNHNGVIDAIDDTLDLIQALRKRGFAEKNIRYLEIENGLHEPRTWGEAMPDFLSWGMGEVL